MSTDVVQMTQGSAGRVRINLAVGDPYRSQKLKQLGLRNADPQFYLTVLRVRGVDHVDVGLEHGQDQLNEAVTGTAQP